MADLSEQQRHLIMVSIAGHPGFGLFVAHQGDGRGARW
jgi:amino acid permease